MFGAQLLCGSVSALHEAVAVTDDSGHSHAAQEAQLGLAVLGDRVAGQVACLLFLEGDAVAVGGDGIGADIALGHVNSDELDIRVLISSPSQRSTVQVADADDHVCTVVDSLTDHGLTILIRSVSLGDVVLAVIAHVAGNSRPACLVEALIVDRAGVAGQSDLDDLASPPSAAEEAVEEQQRKKRCWWKKRKNRHKRSEQRRRQQHQPQPGSYDEKSS